MHAPHPRCRTIPSWALAAALLLPAARAAADDSNFRSYLVGGRAAGMGGAYTAIADDGSGPYYNPSGIAFAKKSSLSLAASVYGYLSGSIHDELGMGHDLSFSDINTFPVSASAVFKFGSTETPGGSKANAIALSVFVPDALIVDDRNTIQGAQNTIFFSGSRQSIWGGATYARRFGRLGLGASGFVEITTEKDFVDLTLAQGSDFAIDTARNDIVAYGVIGALGARLDVTDKLRLGLSLYTPGVGGGARKTYNRLACNISMPTTPTQCPTVKVLSVEDLDAAPTDPLRLQVGGAWESGRSTFAADGIFLGPRDVHFNQGQVATGTAFAGQSLAHHVVRDAVVDVSVGVEHLVTDWLPVRFGFFTDLAAAPHLDAGPAPADPPDNTTHVNRFGGSTSVGYRSDHSSVDVGVIVSYGSGQVASIGQGMVTLHDMTQVLAYVFLSSAYQF